MEYSPPASARVKLTPDPALIAQDNELSEVQDTVQEVAPMEPVMELGVTEKPDPKTVTTRLPLVGRKTGEMDEMVSASYVKASDMEPNLAMTPT